MALFRKKGDEPAPPVKRPKSPVVATPEAAPPPPAEVQHGGGLRIDDPGALGLSRREEEKLYSDFDTLNQDDLTGFIAHHHLYIPAPVPRPADLTPELLNDASGIEYTTAYAQWLAYYNYLARVQAHVVAFYEQSKTQLSVVSNGIKKANIEANQLLPKSERKTIPELEVALETHPTYLHALRVAQEYKQKRLLIDAATDEADRSLRLLSRQIEVKKLDYANNTREPGAQQPRHRSFRNP